MKYNFNILSPIEFEELCKDIISDKLNMEFKSFKIGKDGGIDLRNRENGIICQCKHIKNFSDLKNTLKKEKEKIKTIKGLKKYYLMVSTELTPKNEDEILELMKDYLKSSNQILSIKEIESILEQEEKIEILKRHSKLWLTSYKVLEIFQSKFMDFQVSTLYNEIKNEINYFVETKIFRECLEKIKRERIIIITGSPGVGKTINSNMVVARMISDNPNLKIKTIAGSNYEELIKSLNVDDEELIILDDFLGQSYLEKTSADIDNIILIINYVLKNNRKFLLLNSRLYVISQTKNENEKISRILDLLEANKYLINMDNISLIEKAKIIYNLHYFNKVPFEYFEELRKKALLDYRFEYIIKHRNYNTRIIEYCVLNYKRDEIKKDEYYNYIINNLNNPTKVWKVQFGKLTKEERAYLNIMYSISSNNVSSTILKECYDNVAKTRMYDTEKNNFKIISDKMTNSLIKQNLQHNDIILNVINPSINDYILNDLSKNTVELEKMMKDALYIEQIKNIIKLDNTLLNKLDKSLTEYKTFEDNNRISILKFIIEFKYCNHDLIEYVNNIYKEKNFYGVELLEILSSKKLVEYYKLKSYLEDYDLIEHLFKNSSNYYIEKFISSVDDYLEDYEELKKAEISKEYNKRFSNIIEEKIIDNINSDISYEIDRLIDENLNMVELTIIDEDEYEVSNLDSAYDRIEADVTPIIEEKIDESINEYWYNNIEFENLNIECKEFIDYNYITERLEELKIDEEIKKNNYNNDETKISPYDVFFQEYETNQKAVNPAISGNEKSGETSPK